MNDNKTAEQIICDIIAKHMGLDDQRIWVRNQNKKIPNDDGMFIIVGMVDSIPMSNTYQELPVTVDAVETLKEIITVTTMDNVQIDILSRNNDALLRRAEVLIALNSNYARQQQELYNFKIAKLPASWINASSAEGGSNLNRFTMTIPAYVWYRKESVLSQTEIFDNFGTRVDDAITIGQDVGLIEFTIPAEE